MKLAAAFLGLVVALGVIALVTPPTRMDSDRGNYEAIAERIIIPGCDQLHCFRVLVPWVLGGVPGESLEKWQAYAVICNAAAAIAVWLLCGAWRLPRKGAWYAAFASAFGFGSLYTLYDNYTSDPLMFLAGPLLLLLMTSERQAVAGALAALFITAKEFAVVPIYIHAAASWLEGQRTVAIRSALIAAGAFAVWLALTLWLMRVYHYSYGLNPSADPLHGGYIWHWYLSLNPAVAALAIVAQLGVLWILAPAGWAYAPAALRNATLAAIPPAFALMYLQQPDRALWNFHFLFTPLAGLALSRVPTALAMTTLAAFALCNLRFGAQLSFVPSMRTTLGASLVLGAACCGWVWSQRGLPVHE